MASPKSDAVILYLDPTPLIKELESRNLLREVSSDTIKRWQNKGIDVYWADKWSIKLGMHPFEIFGMDFYQDGVPRNSIALLSR